MTQCKGGEGLSIVRKTSVLDLDRVHRRLRVQIVSRTM